MTEILVINRTPYDLDLTWIVDPGQTPDRNVLTITEPSILTSASEAPRVDANGGTVVIRTET